MRQKSWKKIIALILTVCLFVITPYMTAYSAGVPGLNAPATRKNVMKLLYRYDKNGAYLLKTTKKYGDYMVWFFKGQRITDTIDVAVHEQCHVYTWTRVKSFHENNIYIGNKKKIRVKFSKIFRTKKMARSIPKRCRTFRYPVYISKADPKLTANQDGIYGLMDEFNAYHWGMNTNVALYKYYKRFGLESDAWDTFVDIGLNGKQAYAEFKYYILHYLYYAKKHYPKVYRGIMANKNFKRAYRKTEKHYAKLIRQFDKELISIGCEPDYDPFGEIKVLFKELNKKRYRSIHKKLMHDN